MTFVKYFALGYYNSSEGNKAEPLNPQVSVVFDVAAGIGTINSQPGITCRELFIGNLFCFVVFLNHGPQIHYPYIYITFLPGCVHDLLSMQIQVGIALLEKACKLAFYLCHDTNQIDFVIFFVKLPDQTVHISHHVNIFCISTIIKGPDTPYRYHVTTLFV